MKRTLLSIVCLTMISFYSFSQVWTPQGLGLTTANRGVMNISIASSQVAWVSTYDGSGSNAPVQDYSKTVNGGTNWTPGNVNATTGLAFSQIFGLNATTAWALLYKSTGTGSQGVYYTTNGGTSWAYQSTAPFSNSASFPDWIYFWDANNGIVTGDPINNHFEIYTTSNAGATWVALPTANSPVILSGETGWTSNYCVHGNYIWFGTSKGRVFASTDMGQHWTAAAAFATTKDPYPAYKDSLNGLALKYQSTTDTLNLLESSVNGGTSYTALTYSGKPFAGEIKFIPNSPNTYGTTGADATNQKGMLGFSYSFDGGNSWTIEPSIHGTQLTCSAWLNDSTGWVGSFAATTSDGIYKLKGVLAQAIANFMTPDTLLTLGGQAIFTNLSTGSPTTYAWTFTGGIPASSTLKTPPAITYNTPGTFAVKLVATNSFGSNTLTKTAYIHVGGVGVNEINQNSVSVYPNPVKDMMTVQANSNIKEVTLYNLTGQVVLNQAIDAKKITLSTTGLSAGIYTLKAILDNGTITKKVVIQ